MTTASEAMKAFYRAEGLPDHGNQEGRVDWAVVLGVRVPFPNLAYRKTLLPWHDLIHIATGYHTDEAGESEVGAWSLAAGGEPVTAFPYDLGAFANGLVRAPRRTIAAFYRGRQGRSLYRHPLPELLAATVDELRALAGTDRPLRTPTASDHLALLAYVALVVAAPTLTMTVLVFAWVG